jgi:uncharacterized membrane protein YfcA
MKESMAISSFSIMLSTFARFIFNFYEKHPEKPNVISIDYGITNVMMPLTVIGSIFGAYIYFSFPEIILTIILTIMLFILNIESAKKFI